MVLYMYLLKRAVLIFCSLLIVQDVYCRYMGGPVVDGSMQMAVMNQGPMHQSMGGASQPHMGVQHLGGQPLGGFNHGSPFHQPRGESHSYSSGYSSQQVS